MDYRKMFPEKNNTVQEGIFPQKIYSSFSSGFALQLTNSYHKLPMENAETLINMEMDRIKSNYSLEEENFVEQMLQENPIICERRTSSNGTNSSSYSVRDPLQQQRAESCRKSRINNKVKKAIGKFRHKYITMKLAQSVNALKSIQDVIAQAEAQLLRNGCSESALQKLRTNLGVGTGDASRWNSLENTLNG